MNRTCTQTSLFLDNPFRLDLINDLMCHRVTVQLKFTCVFMCTYEGAVTLGIIV